MKCSQYNILSTFVVGVLTMTMLPLSFSYAQPESGVIITDSICEEVSFSGFTTGGFLSASPRTVGVDESVLMTGRFLNRTNMSVPDEKVYVVLFSADSNSAVPVSIQKTSETLHFSPNEEKIVPVEWVLPGYLGEGNYQAYLYTSQASDVREVWASVIATASSLRESTNATPIQVNASVGQSFSQFVSEVTINGSTVANQSEVAEWFLLEDNRLDMNVQLANNTNNEVLRGQLTATLHSDVAPVQSNLLKEQSRELRLLPNRTLDFQITETVQGPFAAVAVWFQPDNGGEQLVSWIPLTTELEWQNRLVSLDESVPRILGVGLSEESIISCVQFPRTESDEILFDGHTFNLVIDSSSDNPLRYEGLLFTGQTFESSFAQTYGIEIARPQQVESYTIDVLLSPLLEFSSSLNHQSFDRSLVISYSCESYASCSPLVSEDGSDKSSQLTFYIASIILLGLLVLLLFLLRRRRIQSI